MTLFEILILAVVQGLTEFLPVSSSGHLVVSNGLLESMGNAPAPDVLEVNVALHIGTLLSVLVYYRREIIQLVTTNRQLIGPLIVGTLPALLAGLLLKKVVPETLADSILENPLVAGFMFPVTALVLWAATYWRTSGEREYSQVSYLDALLVGIAQAAAILPGISRSGSTIAAGQAVGLRRDAAATFAFLLSIPVIAGAGVLESLDIIDAGGTSTPWHLLLIGVAVSFGVGLAALALLIRFVRAGKLAFFSYYLVPLGVAVIVWQLMA